jgi:hypothetical protein
MLAGKKTGRFQKHLSAFAAQFGIEASRNGDVRD